MKKSLRVVGKKPLKNSSKTNGIHIKILYSMNLGTTFIIAMINSTKMNDGKSQEGMV